MSSKVPNAADLVDMTSLGPSENKEGLLPDVPIEHLDYDFVKKCEDWKKLRDVLLVLRSGKEGRFPHLEQVVEHRMLQFMPAEQKSQWLAVNGSKPDYDEQAKAKQDVTEWIRNMKSKRESTGKEILDETTSEQRRNRASERCLPPPRGFSSKQQRQQNGHSEPQQHVAKTAISMQKGSDKQNTLTQQRPKREPKADDLGSYYNKWDEIDVDKMLQEEEDENKTQQQTNRQQSSNKQAMASGDTSGKDLKLAVDPVTLSEQERDYNANNEKDKGNDCFRSGDLENALFYYSRSLVFDPQKPLVLCNRAQVYLKLKRYFKAIEDCTAALNIDSSLIKAWVRRGKAKLAQGEYVEAVKDFSQAKELEPSNKEVCRLLLSAQQKCEKNDKMDSVASTSSESCTPPAPGARRVPIIEDDDNDDDDDDHDEKRSDRYVSSRTETETSKLSSGSSVGATQPESRRKPMKRVTIEEEDSDDDDENENQQAKNGANENQSEEKNHDTAESLKEKGNNAFKYGNLSEAVSYYTASLEKDSQQIATYSNRAMVYLELSRYTEALADCENGMKCINFRSVDKFVQEQQKNPSSHEPVRKILVKIIYRKALSLKHLERYSEALGCLNEVEKIESDNSRIKQEIDELKRKAKVSNSKEGSYETAKADDSYDAFETATRVSGRLLSEIAIPAPPKTAYELESVCNSFRNDMKKLSGYIKQIKPVKIKKLFKRPVETDLLSRIIDVAHHIAATDDPKFGVDLIKTIAETPHFSMSALMLSADDQDKVRKTIGFYNRDDSPRVHKIKEAYRL